MTWGSNIVLTKNGTQVTVQLTDGDEEVLNKILTKITPPNPTANKDSGPKDTRIVDLQRIERQIIIKGEIVTDQATEVGGGSFSTGDTHTNASDKKADLRDMFSAGGVLTMTYESQSLTGNLEKISLSRKLGATSEPGEGEAGFDVQFTFIVGVDI